MKKIKVKVPAKINLTLDILGAEKGYHNLKSLVASINIYDTITIKRRTDWDVTLVNKGIDPNCDKLSNNAYKAAKLFSDTFITEGVDIVIQKNIPVGAGLGGSSADVAGVLNGMKAMFAPDKDVVGLANTLGSDCAYMLNGGWAIMSGKGDKVDFKKVDKTLYLIIILARNGVSSGACYKKFDSLKKISKPCTDKTYKAFMENEFEKFCSCAKNDLYAPAKYFVEELDFNEKALKKAGAPLVVMTGSGSAMLGVFIDKKQRDKVYKTLKPIYKQEILKAQTL